MTDRRYIDEIGVRSLLSSLYSWRTSSDSTFAGKSGDSEKLEGHTLSDFVLGKDYLVKISQIEKSISDEASRAIGEEQRIEGKIDHMFEDMHPEGDDPYILAKHTLQSVSDVIAQGTVIGLHGVAAYGIADPTSEGGGGGNYDILPYSRLDTAGKEFMNTLTTAYAVNEVKKLVTAETSARTKDVRDLATSINGLSQTIQNYTFADLKETPTTIAGYGIEDADVGHVQMENLDYMSYVVIGDDEIEIEPIPEDEVAAIFTL